MSFSDLFRSDAPTVLALDFLQGEQMGRNISLPSPTQPAAVMEAPSLQEFSFEVMDWSVGKTHTAWCGCQGWQPGKKADRGHSLETLQELIYLSSTEAAFAHLGLS